MLRAVSVITATIIVTFSINVAHSVASFCAVIAGAAIWVNTSVESTVIDNTGAACIFSAIVVFLTAWVVFAISWRHTLPAKIVVIAGCVVPDSAALAIVALDGEGPVANGTIGVLVTRVKSESPLIIAGTICSNFRLATSTLEQTGLDGWPALPEPTAI